MIRRFIFLLFSLAILFLFQGQTTKDAFTPDQSLPTGISKRLDSLRRADDLEQWLYACMGYEENNTAKYVNFISKAQSLIWRPCRNDSESLAKFYFSATLGYWQIYSGNVLRSIEAYEEAYRFYFAKPIPGADVLEYVLKPLGNNYTRLGDYDRAFFIQEKSLKLAEQKDPSQIASICHNLATTARWRGDLLQAEQYCGKGMQAVKKNSALHGLLLSTLSEIFFESKRISEAEAANKEAIKILERQITDKKEINVPYWLSGAYQGRGDIQKEKNESAAALHSYEKATAILDNYYKGQRKREKAKLYVSTGQLFLHLQQFQKAIDHFNTALSVLLPAYDPRSIYELPAPGELYGENTLLDALHGKADCLKAMNKKDEALQCYLLLFVTERKLRHEFFSPAARQQQQKENRQWVESAMETAYQLWKKSGKKEYADKVLLIAEMSKAQLLLDELVGNLHYGKPGSGDSLLEKQLQITKAVAYYERESILNSETGKPDSSVVAAKKELQYELSLIEKQVKEKYPMLRGYLQEEQMPSPGSLLRSIPANMNVIEFFTGEKNIYIIEASKGSINQIRHLEDAGQVQQDVKGFVSTYFQAGPDKMMNDPEQYYKEAYRIYHMLWQGTGTEKQDPCIIIPDGILGYLPFDALVTDSVYRSNIDQWPFLIKQSNLFFNYSLQTWQQQLKIEHNNKQFAGFFISFDSSKKASLPAVKKEYEAIKNTVKGNFFTEQKATLKEFKATLGQVNLLHISTHSFLQGKENIPVLQLADADFFLFELYGKAFQPQLIVLSACRTGQGMLAEGEGIISLARGFTATGAGGIVAGLWDMNDESTAELMGNFYKLLAKDKRPADALYAAKLEWMSQQHAQSFKKLPYFWAGLIYVGDNQPVDLTKKNAAPAVIGWVAAALLTIVLILVFLKRLKKKVTG